MVFYHLSVILSIFNYKFYSFCDIFTNFGSYFLQIKKSFVIFCISKHKIYIDFTVCLCYNYMVIFEFGGRMMKVTLSDIAKATGFSVNTVSHALSGKPDISEKTRSIIKDAAEKLGYLKNYAASCMRTGKSMMVAIIIPDIKNPFFSVIIRDIESILFKEGYTVAIFNTNEDANHERAAIDACLVRNMDGIIICPTQKSVANISFLKNSSVPYILMSRHFGDMSCTCVGHDDIKGGYLATRHLVDLGHRRIAFFSADQRISSASERLEGYKEALREAGIMHNPLNVISLSTTASTENTAPIKTFFDKNPDCTAVVAFNDIIAFQTIHFLEKIGKRVPEDVSVVGFDNVSSDFIFPFPLTSISVSKKEMATVTARLLIEAITAKSPPPTQRIVLSSQLLVRDSTARAKT